MAFDATILQWLNSWAGINPFIDQLIIFLAVYLWYVVIAGVLFLVIITLFSKFVHLRRRHLELFLIASASAFTARFIITALIHILYNRSRPFDLLAEALAKAGVDHVTQLIPHVSGGSFPSGHASLAFAVATAVSFYYPKTSLLFFASALSIGLGRVAAGVHWPSDILGGAVVGVGTAWLARFIWQKFKNKTTA